MEDREVELELEQWGGEELLIRRDAPTGAWIGIAIHSTVRGPAVGGTRLRRYPSVHAALVDVLRLSAGMTVKNAVAGLPCGGGKAVIAVPGPLTDGEREALLERYAEMIDGLGGRFATGPDIGTGEADMDVIGRRTAHVFCRSLGRGGSGTASPWTAAGVLAGIRATLRHRTGSDDLAGRQVLIQGLGEVGGVLARLLHDAGARLLLADVDRERVRATVAALPGSVEVAAEAVSGTECDVYSPCAIGGVLNSESIPQLRCLIVAGAANNQLLEEADADCLRAAGILYAPDFVINSGGIMRGIGAERLGWSDAQIDARIQAIGETLEEIYRASERLDISTAAAASRLAQEALTPVEVAARPG